MCSYRILVLLVCTAACLRISPLHAKHKGQGSHYNMKQGLAGDVVLCLFQDSHGFIWAGTVSGLNKFDGYKFTTYRPTIGDTTGLSHGVVNSLWEDKNERLWIGTANGLDLLDLRTEKFTHLALDSQKGADILQIRKLRERKDGKVWVCTSQGVFLIDPSSLDIVNAFDLPNAWDITESGDKVVWVSTNQGIVKVTNYDSQPIRYTYEYDDQFIQAHKTIHVDSLDRIWVGGAKNIALFDPVTTRFSHYAPKNLPLRTKVDIKVILETVGGKLLIGSSRGLDVFDPIAGEFEQILEISVWSLLRDRQNNLWVGTSKGIFQISPHGPNFKIINDFGPTHVTDVRVTVKDNEDHIWMVTNNPNQLFRYDPYSGYFERYSHEKNNPLSFSGDPVTDVIPSTDGGIWIASYYQLEKFSLKEQSFSKTALPFDPIRILIDSDNTMWVGGYKQFGQYNFTSQTFNPIANHLEHVTCFIEDRSKNLWIGSRDGLFRFNKKTGELQVYKKDLLMQQGLSNSWISCLMIDEQGTIWVGTLGGLNKMIPGTESTEPKFIYWNTSNSDIPFDAVAGIVDGGDGTLWISSGNQISHFFTKEIKFRNYDHTDGLHGGAVYGGFKGPTGVIYMSSRDGLLMFHPDSLINNNYVPPIEITSLMINNQKIAISRHKKSTSKQEAPLKMSLTYVDTLELAYNQRDFALEFTALNYVNSENNKYKYKLEPYEKQWIETSAENRVARYTNMSPGYYTFHVVGSNNDGLWNEKGRSLTVLIEPPLWGTWWAYVLYAICGLSWIIALRHYEKKRFILGQKAKSLEEIDRAKSEFLTNISHELRTPLTLILGPLKALKQETYKGDRRSLYSMMSHNGERLLQLVNQLLDLSKLDQGKMTLNLENCHLNNLIRQILVNFDTACLMKQLDLQFHEDSSSIYCRLDPEKIKQVLVNLVSNAIKFTPVHGHISVTVRRVSQAHPDDYLTIQVKDSGIGISQEEVDNIFDRFYQVRQVHQHELEGTGIGLAVVQKLVQLHSGEVKVESELGWGSTFTVTLPFIAADADPIAEQTEEIKTKPAKMQPNPKEECHPQKLRSRPTLLLVEDNAQMRHYIKSCLGEHYQYLEAENGDQALRLAQDRIPDLILCDVMMPVMDGYEFCSKLREQQATAHIPFIFLTARADRKSKLRGLEIGSGDYVIKPFETDELRLKVRNRLSKMQQYRQFFTNQLAINGDIDAVQSLDNVFLNRALELIQQHLDNHEFTVQEFSHQLGLSQTQLYRKLITLTGQSPSAFIRGIRLKKAAQLIVQQYGNTSEVAYAVGFNNLSYFTKCFKEQFGIVPSGYVKKISNDTS